MSGKAKQHRRTRFAVRCHRAHDLMPKWGSSADPYCKLKVAGRKYKTRIMGRTLNPKWDEWFDIDWPRNDVLVVSVWSAGTIKNDFLGQLQFEFPDANVCETGHQKITQRLRPGPTGGPVSGSLVLEIVNVELKRAWEKANPDKVDRPVAAEEGKGRPAVLKMSCGTPFSVNSHQNTSSLTPLVGEYKHPP